MEPEKKIEEAKISSTPQSEPRIVTNEREEQPAYSEEERKNMRNKVLGWLKAHPQSKNSESSEMPVIVPKQKRSFVWPWSKKKKPVIKNKITPQPKPVVKTADASILPKEKIVTPIEENKPEESIVKETEEKPIEIKEDKPDQTPAWPPVSVEAEQIDKIENKKEIATTPQPSLKADSKPLIEDTHDALLEEGEDLLPVGEDIISEDKHAQILEKIDEDINDKSDSVESKIVEEAKKYRTSRFKLPKVTFANSYKTIAGIFVVVTLLGVFSPLFNAGAFSRFTPTPYGLVGNTLVFRSAYEKELNALKQFQASQNLTNLPAGELEKQVETAIIRRTITAELAKEEEIWVTQEEVDSELQKIAEQAGSLEQVETTINNLWGWSLNEYKKFIIKPLLIKKELQIKLSEDPVLRNEVGQPGDIAQFDRYLDSLRQNYRVIIF